MKKKLALTLVLSILVLQSLVVTVSKADPTYDMLIITPDVFEDEIQPLKQFKDATGRPTVIATLEDIYAIYPGADKAEQVKYCIAAFEAANHIKYVMLVGDVDKLPIRYFLVQTNNDTGSQINWFAYYMTDHYYADLYDSGGSFCSWNADGDQYYAETVRDYDTDYFPNEDGIDYNFDVIVSRLPASTEQDVTNYVNRVIEYESTVDTDDDWFKNIMLVTGVGGSIYPEEPEPGDPTPYYDIVQLNSLGARLTPHGFTEIKLYHENDPGGNYYPTVANVNMHLNNGVGIFTILSHQNRQSFGIYSFPGDMTGLANDGKYPVFFSLGCSPAQIGPIAPNQDYLDTSGTLQNYGYSYPVPYPFTRPHPPNVLQTTTDLAAIPEDLLCNHNNKGGIAFIGSMAEASSYMGYPASDYFHQSIADGERILGEVWSDVSTEINTHNNPMNSWERSRRWMFLNLFGDPSLYIGGLPDKPPSSYITIGTPQHNSGGITYISSATTLTITVTDDSAPSTAYYRYYKTTPGTWNPGSTFSMTGSNGAYTIEYYGTDTAGNIEVPYNSAFVTLDNAPPSSTISIGSPKHTAGTNTYVTSDTHIQLSATDALSGLSYLEYRINSGPWIPYSGYFEVTGSDGAYLIDYRSADHLGNIEPIQSTTLHLDNTPPTITTTIGSPQYTNDTGDLWVKSTTPFTITASDAGSGTNTIDYVLHYKSYDTPFTYTGPFTLPADINNNCVEFTIEIIVKDNLLNQHTETLDTWVDDREPFTWTYNTDPLYWEYGVTDHPYIRSDTEFWFEPKDEDAYNKGVGPDFTMYRIDGTDPDPYTLYTPGDTFVITGADGLHHFNCYSVDYLGNAEDPNEYTYEYYLDNTPPETTIHIGTPNHYTASDIYVSSATDLTLTAEDTGAGVQYTEYRIDGGALTTYSGAFYLTGYSDGPHLIEFHSVDNVGNIEDMKSQILIVDNTPPEVNIDAPENEDYVYGLIQIEMTATDEGSGVDFVEYSLDNGVTWLMATYDSINEKWIGTWDTTLFSEGTHTILARATDNVENTGFDETPPTVTVVYLEYMIEFSDSNWNSITEFTAIFNEQKPGTYKISTNPGAIYEIITITNTGTMVTLPELILDIMIPIETDFLGPGAEAFDFQGAKSVHIYKNEIDVTPDGKWNPELDNFDVMQALEPGDSIEIYLHYDYAFKGEKYTDPEVSTWLGEDYTFESDILSAYGPSWMSILPALPSIE